MPRFLTPGGQPICYDDSGGDGTLVILLHGFPQTRAMWDPIAPQLADRWRVLSPDLRGYGDSSDPSLRPDMSFRAMAQDVVDLMDHHGIVRAHIVGHDRGARVAHRFALDHPARTHSVTLMDIIPTQDLFASLTAEMAQAYYHWFFLSQPHPFPETLIAHDPDAYFERCLLGFGKANLSDFPASQLTAYRDAWHRPEVIRAMCDDYRAAYEVDRHHDAQDLDRQVTCPALVLYGQDGAMGQMLDVTARWSDRLSQMKALAVPGGHFFPDQSPKATAQALRSFLEQQAL